MFARIGEKFKMLSITGPFNNCLSNYATNWSYTAWGQRDLLIIWGYTPVWLSDIDSQKHIPSYIWNSQIDLNCDWYDSPIT